MIAEFVCAVGKRDLRQRRIRKRIRAEISHRVAAERKGSKLRAAVKQIIGNGIAVIFRLRQFLAVVEHITAEARCLAHRNGFQIRTAVENVLARGAESRQIDFFQRGTASKRIIVRRGDPRGIGNGFQTRTAVERMSADRKRTGIFFPRYFIFRFAQFDLFEIFQSAECVLVDDFTLGGNDDPFQIVASRETVFGKGSKRDRKDDRFDQFIVFKRFFFDRHNVFGIGNFTVRAAVIFIEPIVGNIQLVFDRDLHADGGRIVSLYADRNIRVTFCKRGNFAVFVHDDRFHVRTRIFIDGLVNRFGVPRFDVCLNLTRHVGFEFDLSAG